MKRVLFTLCAIVLLSTTSHAEDNISLQPLSKNLNLEVTTGLQGAFSFAQVGVNLPQFIEHSLIGIKFRGMSSLTWATFIHEQTKASVSFHPVVMGVVLTMGGTGNMVNNLFRSYGNMELLIGNTFTPYDSAIYGVGNLVGDNLTVGIFGTFGLEFFTTNSISIFVESGGGFKTMKGDKNNQYLIASSWLGSGVTFRMGSKIYF